MRILIDVQTLYTNEKTRGIGILTKHWIEQIMKRSPHHRFYLYRKSDSAWEFTFCSSSLRLDERLNDDYVWQKCDMDEFIQNKDISLIYFPSPYMFDITIPILKTKKVKKVYFLHDLIPLAMKAEFYSKWPSQLQKEYDQRGMLLQNADLILTNSEASKRDAMKFLSIPSERIEVVYASTNEELYTSVRNGRESTLLASELHMNKPFIYALTGYDARKNNKGLIEAFADVSLRFPDINLIISGIKLESEQAELYEIAAKAGLDKSKVIFLGFVSDDLLLSLYKECEFFVYPSLYEGFGLPVLEAMRCGTAVITTTSSSLPEVGGEAAILVDPYNSQQLGLAMIEMLLSSDKRDEAREKSILQAKKFSWEQVGAKSLSAIEKLLHIAPIVMTLKPELAFFSPLNPEKSGISDYSEEMIPFLSKYFELTIVVNGLELTNEDIASNYNIIDYSKHRERLEKIPRRLYHMGNNELHKWIYRAMENYPGNVLIHDLNMFGMFVHTVYLKGNKEEFYHLLTYSHREEGSRAVEEIKSAGIIPDSQRFPMNGKIMDLSTGIFVHSQWAKDQLIRHSSYHGPISVLPFGFVQPPQVDKRAIRGQLKMKEDQIHLGVFGNVVPSKRIPVILQVFARLQMTHPSTCLYLIGHIDSDSRSLTNKQIKELGLKNTVKIIESPDLATFDHYIAAMDVCINLRYPTMGETSATLMRAIGFGIPSIVSNVGSYQEYPDDFVWKVDVDQCEEDLLLSYLIELCSNRLLRSQMGDIAIDYVEKNYSYEIASRLLFKEITAVI
ncbi:glycosyltransferase [Paenibacillus humicus]|uniref:glycosyltransferase n=1 Tax=Paenibacillus humicus TaxID=412861 RepID=UPI003F178A9E